MIYKKKMVVALVRVGEGVARRVLGTLRRPPPPALDSRTIRSGRTYIHTTRCSRDGCGGWVREMSEFSAGRCTQREHLRGMMSPRSQGQRSAVSTVHRRVLTFLASIDTWREVTRPPSIAGSLLRAP